MTVRAASGHIMQLCFMTPLAQRLNNTFNFLSLILLQSEMISDSITLPWSTFLAVVIV